MAGHNKWSKIKHVKARGDSQRSQKFAKLTREIAMAVKVSGPDPDMNARLRVALVKCRAVNMPQENIQRTIKRAAGGEGGTDFSELVYEIFGPHGVAILCEVATDNRNRTASDIRAILTRHEGKLATTGAVSRLFTRQGQILVARANAEEESLMALALEAGAEDFKADENGYEILTDPLDFEAVHKNIEAAGIKCESAEITALAQTIVSLDAVRAAPVNRLIEVLDEHDDVKEVYSNAEFTA